MKQPYNYDRVQLIYPAEAKCIYPGIVEEFTTKHSSDSPYFNRGFEVAIEAYNQLTLIQRIMKKELSNEGLNCLTAKVDSIHGFEAGRKSYKTLTLWQRIWKEDIGKTYNNPGATGSDYKYIVKYRSY